MYKTFVATLLSLTAFCAVSFVNADYTQHPGAAKFVELMVREHNFSQDDVLSLLSKAEKKQAILDAISRPAEKTKEWFEYRKIFVQESRINQGVEFWQTNKKDITRAAEFFSVAPEIIVAIIGVETRYGRHAGRYRVLDALSTLGFDYPKRGRFFRGQLKEFMLMVREQQQDPLTLMGSYAGAMGYGQFIPSSYRSFAVDFDGDEKIDIWQNTADAIGSVANYFSAHKWIEGGPVLTRARISDDYDKSLLNAKTRPNMSLRELESKGFSSVGPVDDAELKAVPLMFVGDHGKEFWLGFNNFYVITRYNRSHLYAMAVWELSQEVRKRFEQSDGLPNTPVALK